MLSSCCRILLVAMVRALSDFWLRVIGCVLGMFILVVDVCCFCVVVFCLLRACVRSTLYACARLVVLRHRFELTIYFVVSVLGKLIFVFMLCL